MSDFADNLIDNFSTASRNVQKARSTSNLELFSEAWNSLSGYIEELESRIAELETEKSILEDQQREAKNILIDKNLHIDSLYEEGYKLQQRIAELEEQVWDLNLANEKLESAYFADETIAPDGSLKPSVCKLMKRVEKAETDYSISEAHVTALLNRIAELEAAQRWIPVSERLPEKQKLTIGFTDNSAYVFFEIVNDDEMGLVMYPYQNRKGTVTHWMPLPSTPEVQE